MGTNNFLGQKIKQLRISKGLTQSQLVDGLWERSYISLIERGKFTPTMDVVEKLAERLEVPVEELSEWLPDNRNAQIIQEAQGLLDKAKSQCDGSLAQKAWDKFARVHVLDGMIQSVLVWADFAAATWDMIETINYTIPLLSLDKQQSSNEQMCELLICAGNTYYRLGRFDQATWIYKDILNRKPSQQIITRMHLNLGSALYCLLRYEEANEHYSKVLDSKIAPEQWAAMAQQGVGACSRYLGQWDKAYFHMNKASELYSTFDELRYVETQAAIGTLWLDKYEYEKAYSLFMMALEYYESHNLRLNEAELCEEFVRMEFYKQNYDSAKTWCNRGLSMVANLNTNLAGQFFIWKSWIYRMQGNPEAETDAFYGAQTLLGEQLLNVLEFFDPNISDDRKLSITSRIVQ